MLFVSLLSRADLIERRQLNNDDGKDDNDAGDALISDRENS